MKIQAINSFYQNKINNFKAQNPFVVPSKADSLEINFKGIKEKKLKLQALKLEKQASKIYKEASEISHDAYQIQQQARAIKKESAYIVKDSNIVLKEALKSLKQGQMTEHEPIYDKKTGKLIRCYSDENEYGEKIAFTMEDFFLNGKIKRKVVQEEGQILRVIIADSEQKQYKIYLFNLTDKTLLSYIESDDMAEGSLSYSANKQFVFNRNNLVTFDENYRYKNEKGEKSDGHFSFSNGTLNQYCGEWSLSSDGTKETAQERYSYRNGTLHKAQMGFIDVDCEYRKIEEEFYYDDESGLKSCLVGISKEKDSPNSNINCIYAFSDDGLKRIYTDVTLYPQEKRFDSAQMFLCDDEVITKCAFNYSCIGKSKEIYSSLQKIG